MKVFIVVAYFILALVAILAAGFIVYSYGQRDASRKCIEILERR